MHPSTALLAICLFAFGALSAPAHGDDWEQVPSTSENSGTDSAPSQGSDREVIADFFAAVGASPQEHRQGCETIGGFASMMALARDQGVPQPMMQQQITTGFAQKAAEQKLPAKWVAPVQSVLRRQLDYVYAHPDMKPSQAQDYWDRLCRVEAGGGE